ncbi:glutaredoxin family protein [Halomonas daqiaonensis]|uniref:Glutaredoxin-like domain n=1 Tax=Halomonas daqiaonensis TaxID=650850 RepID=A0A1H7KZR8_9GAMM|nr:glutaredoxin family protein [Halomonas daqiaonensis]SEK92232.1 Glutaredoxin-like domain [Halomonas daqiaonensis]
MIRLRLYTTLGCHLCEQLEALLATLCHERYRLERVEISDDEALVARYGMRIPVLVDEAGVELDRGMEPERLVAWLASRGWLDEAAWEMLRRQLAGEGEPREAKGAVMRGGRRYLG